MQWYNATVALDAGVRLLQSQLHKDGSDIKLCHSSCSLFDGGTLTSWLTPIATWMFAHPSEGAFPVAQRQTSLLLTTL